MKTKEKIRLWFFMGLLLLTLTSNSFGQAKLIDLDFKNADIKDVLRALSDQEGVSFLISNEITGNVTIHLTKITFADALSTLTSMYGLAYTNQGQVYNISKYELLNIEYFNNTLSVEAKDTKLRNLFDGLTQKSGVNFILAPDIDSRITINFAKVTLEDGIKAILNQANCIEEKAGNNVYLIKKSTTDHPFSVIYKNNLLSIDAQNIPLSVLTREITTKSGISVIPDQNLNNPINIFFQDLSFKDGLNALCATNGLQLINDGAVWRITRSTGSYRIKATTDLLSVDVDNADIVTVLNEISRQSGVNIIISKDVQGQITSHFQNLPLSQGLMAMMDSRGLILEKQQNYFYVRTNTTNNQNIRITYDMQTKLYDLDVQTAPITNVIYEMARKANLNIVILAQVNWTLNDIRTQKLSFTDTLDLLLKGSIFTYKMVGGTYLIGDGMVIRPENSDFATVKVYPIRYLKADQLMSTLPPVFPRQNFTLMQDKNAIIVCAPPAIQDLFANFLNQVDIESVNNQTEVIKIKYLKADDVLKYFPSSIPKTDVVVIKESNAISVTGPQNLINQVKQYISKIDQVNPMIVFDIVVVQINNSNDVTWDPPTGSFVKNNQTTALSLTSPTLSVSPVSAKDVIGKSLTLLVQQGDAKVLANPSISTLNGYPATFDVSTKRSYSVPTQVVVNGNTQTPTDTTIKTYDAGLTIMITPWVAANNQITMEVKPTISEYDDSSSDPKNPLPQITERSTQTTVRANNKQTLVISGLKSTHKSKNISKIPVLGDIPWLGNLFKSTIITETQDEFVIVITPYLVYDDTSRDEANQKVLNRFNSPDQTPTVNNPPVNKVEPEKKDNK